MLAARALGREMAAVLKPNTLLKQRILNILEENSTVIEQSIIAVLFENQSGDTVEHQYQVLHELREGIKEYTS